MERKQHFWVAFDLPPAPHRGGSKSPSTMGTHGARPHCRSQKIFTSIPAAGLYLGSIISMKFAANGAPLSPMGSVTPLASPNPLGTPGWVRGPPGPHCHIPMVPAEDSAAAGFCPASKMAQELKKHRDIYSDLFFKFIFIFFMSSANPPKKNNKRVLLPRCRAAAFGNGADLGMQQRAGAARGILERIVLGGMGEIKGILGF